MNAHTSETRLRFRQALESEVERLLSLLDGLDGDPDYEESGDEHDTGTNEGWRGHRLSLVGPPMEDDEDDGLDEPILASPENGVRSQSRWAQGGSDERELDEEREEENEHGGDVLDEPHDQVDEGNDEPELGWSNPRWHPGSEPGSLFLRILRQ